jgi:hypothetical protein
MSQQLVKLSYDQGYESVLVALGLEKRAFIWGAAGKMIGAAAKGVGNLVSKAGQKKLPGVIGKPLDAANKMPVQIGTEMGRSGINSAVTNATV